MAAVDALGRSRGVACSAAPASRWSYELTGDRGHLLHGHPRLTRNTSPSGSALERKSDYGSMGLSRALGLFGRESDG
jgi:hypothetical protein